MKKKNNEIKDLLSNQKGVALLTVLIFIFLMVTFVVALMAMTSNDIKLSAMQRDSTKAFYQADGGIEKAIWYLNSSEDNPAGLYFVGSLHGGEVTTEFYDVDISDIDPGPPEIKTLVSTGTIEGGGKYNQNRVVEVKLTKGIKRSPNLTYDYAVLTDGNMTLDGGVTFHGNIHSNSDLTNNGTINMEYGSATATGITNDPVLCTDNQPYQEFPHIYWDYYEDISNTQVIIDGNTYNNYYPGDVTFDASDTLYGVHFIDGNVTISTDLIIHNGTIFATGFIWVKGGTGDVFLDNSENPNPLSLVAKDYIRIDGNVHGEGIIQTESTFTLNGNVNIQKGAIYADDGVFHGGGGSMNVYYDTDLANIVVPGTGIPVWVKISWREVY
ncbi:MAG: hypothetical protein KAW42_01260 [Candidatus Atribacteria bacterium]|nr:hypothetical protein [Candidatus Atribacteria bacterium]